MGNVLAALTGWKTFILCLLYIALTFVTSVLGWHVDGFTPDPDWLRKTVEALGVMALRHGMSTSSVRMAEMALESIAPRVIQSIQRVTGDPPR